MNKIYLALLLLVGIINFIPMIGMVSLSKINQSYGLNVIDQNLAILLRHRALLFGLIGGFTIFSVFSSQYQIPAMILAGTSMLGFLFFFWSSDGSNSSLLKIAQIDIIGVVLLLAAVMIKLFLNDK